MTNSSRLGPFDVAEHIGSGGMGDVYRGEHRSTEVPVAIKVIRQEVGGDAHRRFHEEIQAHAALQHPGLVYLFDYGEIACEATEAPGGEFRAGDPFVAMGLAERTEGHPLFAMQLLAHWIDEGVLEAAPDGFRVPGDRQVELPADIHELWMDRIDRLVERSVGPTRAQIRTAPRWVADYGRAPQLRRNFDLPMVEQDTALPRNCLSVDGSTRHPTARTPDFGVSRHRRMALLRRPIDVPNCR